MEKTTTFGDRSRKQLVVPVDASVIRSEARFGALFPQTTIEKLPDEDKRRLKSWPSTKGTDDVHGFVVADIEALAIEGTTPASSTLYDNDSSSRETQTSYVAKQEKAIAKVTPNVMRSVKVLHVGGSSSGSTHRFYRDIVEITFPRSHPFWSDRALREQNAVSSQYVMSRGDEGHTTSAGATPKDIQLEEYLMVPLLTGTPPLSARPAGDTRSGGR
eukprot:4987589-Prymnesium_polylepis.1